MRVLVSGGTGFIGQALVCSLTERGDDVAVLSRGTTARTKRCHLGPRPFCGRGAGSVEIVQWNPSEPGDWMKAVDGADAIVNLAGAGIFDERWTPERREILRSSRIRSTLLLAEAIARATKRPKVFVSGSAVGYYGTDVGDREVTEADPPGKDFLAQLCVDWEAAAAAARDAGTRVCHPRTGLVLAQSGGSLAKMLPAFRAFVGGPVGSGAQYMGWIHMVDAVRALEHAIDSDIDGPFNLTTPAPVTMNEFAQTLGSALGRPSIFRVPTFAVKLAFGDRAEAVLTGQRAIPRRLVESGFDFVFPELASALADIVATGGRPPASAVPPPSA